MLPATGEIRRAEVFVWRGTSAPAICRGVLVLCPGQNGSSKDMVENPEWRRFAERENLALAGIRFESKDEDLKNGRGYFVASRGSGKLLEEGLAKGGVGKAPLFLYGFSGGAHFAMSFAAWRPERVAGFCAYSFAWWSPPPETLACPALIVCGQADGTRYGSTLGYFQAGRKAGKPWTWVSLKETAHTPTPDLDDFVRAYFACLMARGGGEEEASFDNMTEKKTNSLRKEDISSSVLPCLDLAPKWQKLHHP